MSMQNELSAYLTGSSVARRQGYANLFPALNVDIEGIREDRDTDRAKPLACAVTVQGARSPAVLSGDQGVLPGAAEGVGGHYAVCPVQTPSV